MPPKFSPSLSFKLQVILKIAILTIEGILTLEEEDQVAAIKYCLEYSTTNIQALATEAASKR